MKMIPEFHDHDNHVAQTWATTNMFFHFSSRKSFGTFFDNRHHCFSLITQHEFLCSAIDRCLCPAAQKKFWCILGEKI